LQEARQQLYRDLTDKNIAYDIDGECLKLNNTSTNICFHPDPTRTVKGSVTPETWDQFSNYNKLRAEAEMQASQRLREAIFATIQKTANDLEAQRQATEFSYRKRIHETEQTRNELEWQQRNVSLEFSEFPAQKFLQLWKSVRNFSSCKKLQIISEKSAQNAFVNQDF
jgi:tektin-2